MILYFSGTGNSRHVALSLGNLLHQPVLSLTDTPVHEIKESDKTLIMVFPVYSWGIPPLVAEYIRGFNDSLVEDIRKKDTAIIMVCTCGDETAMAPEMFRDEWRKRGVDVKAVWSVTMPNNYVLLPGFDVDSGEIERQKLIDSASRIRHIADYISAGTWESDIVRGKWPRLKSRLVYPLFRRWGISPEKWHVSDICVGCGLCVKACPVHNVRLESGHPVWGRGCVSCTACYHTCPVNAVSYWRMTKGKGQYICRLKPIWPDS